MEKERERVGKLVRWINLARSLHVKVITTAPTIAHKETAVTINQTRKAAEISANTLPLTAQMRPGLK